ncbi:TLC domain-containing protein 5a isoform X2 [Gadus macrocephalus]|nr:TLC domain-containing protein 5a isoform X2 [Gadus macrocephalus]XP_059930322.1 TLC domain-containing protein 5a isoform X2 [Gadus macrocephalus]
MTLLAAVVLLCLSGWVALYVILCNINGSRGYEWNCRLVTLLHGVLVVCITAYIGYVDGPWPFTYPGTKNTPLQISAMVLSLSYFIFDMVWCMYFRTEGPVMLAHHTVSILGIVVTLWLGESGVESCAVLFGSEITNPLLQARWFLRRTGRYETALGEAVDLAFVLLFVFMRVFVGGAMLYCELISPRPRFFIKCGGVAMYALSWVFMVDIWRFAKRKYGSKMAQWREQGARSLKNGAVVGDDAHEGKLD